VTQDLTQRAQSILAAVIANYIKTAEPVGSKTVARRDDIEVSPATIRNVMAELEELGYLTQPHASAGRIPTSDGLRFYVDSILEVRELDESIKHKLRLALPTDEAASHLDISELLKATGKALSGLSQQVAVVSAPHPDQEVLRQIEFILLDSGLILVVIVTRAGAVQNRIIEADTALRQEDLDKFSRYLSDLMANLTLTEVKKRLASEMAREKMRFDKVLGQALNLSQQALTYEVQNDIIIEGQTKLMEAPEFNDVARLRQIFAAFEEKSTILGLLEKSLLAQGVRIFIGSDSQEEYMEGLSAITSSYGTSNTPVGALGVIGPTRMNYSKVIPIVDYTAKLISRLLDQRC
jgi:heat-inducible transcriptional repressor